MSKSKSPTEWLDELLIKHCPDLTDVQHIKLRQAILNHVEELVNEVIGSDEPLVEHDSESLTHIANYDRVLRNSLRAVQRTQAKQLIKGKD